MVYYEKYTLAEWRERYNKMKAIANRITTMRRERAKRLCKEAGLDPSLLGIHPHNAMVSYNAGQPWPGVDYSKVRACLRVMNSMYDPHRIIERWDRRVRHL